MPTRFRSISVVGLGYIGLPTATVLANRGVRVIGVDINAAAVKAINDGHAHFVESELDALVRHAVGTGYLRAVTTPEPADAFIIAVPTPVAADHAPDLGYIESAGASIGRVLSQGNLVILESTAPVGATAALSRQLAAIRPDLSFPHQAGEDADIRIAYCPERVLPGRIMTELIENDRVIGGLSGASVEAAAALYSLFHRGRLLRTDARTAEMVKLVENAYRDVNIAFANEIARLCGHFGLDVWEVRQLANRHPRVDLLKPGPGVGGHCIAVDPWFLVHAAPNLTPLIQTARQVNDSRPLDIVDAVRAVARPGELIACLGLAYKSNNGDLRESPACAVAEHLHAAGLGPLLAVEPYIEQLPAHLALLDITLADLDQALERAKLIVLLVDHQEFRCLDPARLEGKRVIDTRGCWVSSSLETRRDDHALNDQRGAILAAVSH